MKHFQKSFVFAWNGLRRAFSEQPNIRIHVVVSIIVIGLGSYYRITAGEWLVVVLCIGFVMATELINTAIEYFVDLVSPHHQPLAGKVKDIAAGSVLVAAITAAVAGLIVFTKYIFPDA